MNTLSFSEYREKVLGCWLGKAVGGTLGGPFEGHQKPLNLSFYEPVPETMLPNDDLDLQVAWAEVIRAHGLPIHRRLLADAWLRHIQLWPDEYGVACRNLSAGIYPPASGAFDNGFTAGMGAAIRTELWACLAPGDPELACALTREDACVDHGPDGEGVYAAVYLAYLESAAFVETDRETLLDGAQSSIPAESRVARAIADTRKWWAETGDWNRVRERIYAEHVRQNFTDVAQNLAFTVLGWLAGRDFGDAICIAVNCGMDTDCTGATLGALLGILDPAGIGEEWLKPIGRSMVLSPGMVGMHPAATLDEFTDQVAGIAVAVQGYYGAKWSLSGVPDSIRAAAASLPVRATGGKLLLMPEDAAPEESLVAAEPLAVFLTYPQGTSLLPGTASTLTLRVANPTDAPIAGIRLHARVPAGWTISGGEATFDLAPGADHTATLTVTPPPASAPRIALNPLDLDFTAAGLTWRVSAGLPTTLPWRIASTDTPAGANDACPTLPASAAVLEAHGHFVPLPESGGTHLLAAEIQIPYHVQGRIILQTPKGCAVRAWLDGNPLLAHDGGYEVSAIHRPGGASKDGLYKRGWHRLTVAVRKEEGISGALFFGLGDAATWDWVRSLEWRVAETEG